MHPDAHPAFVERLHRERIVDFGGLAVIDRKRFDLRQRQGIGRDRRRLHRRVEPGAAREPFDGEARAMQRLAVRERAGFVQHPHRRAGKALRGLFECLVFDGVLVGAKRDESRARRRIAGAGRRGPVGRQTLRTQFFDHGGLLRRLLLTALLTRERGLEFGLGRTLVAALAFAPEIHGRAMHAQQQSRGLDRVGRMAEVVRAERDRLEFLVRRDFPQKGQIDRLGHGLRIAHQIGRRRLGELINNVRRLDLGATSRGQFDLITRRRRRTCCVENRADFEPAIFFKKKVHAALQ